LRICAKAAQIPKNENLHLCGRNTPTNRRFLALTDRLAADLIEQSLKPGLGLLVILSLMFSTAATTLYYEHVAAVVAKIRIDRCVAMEAKRLVVIAHNEPVFLTLWAR
jgi:hypothetical protein